MGNQKSSEDRPEHRASAMSFRYNGYVRYKSVQSINQSIINSSTMTAQMISLNWRTGLVSQFIPAMLNPGKRL
jgi:hypothetical protein